MNTPDHAFWTYTVFHKKGWWTKAVVASVLPDLPFIISSVFFFLMYGMSMDVWIRAFENPWVKPIGFFSHSLLIAIPGLTIAVYLGKKSCYPYFYGWILHIFTDILTHVSDAQPILWPLSERRFPGLVSYWEPRHHGHEFTAVNLTLESLFAIYFLLTRGRYSRDAHSVASTILFGFLSLYVLGGGFIFFLHGYVSTEAFVFRFVAGILFFLVAISAYYLKRKYPL